MGLLEFLQLFGGLAFFLFGMHLLSDGLKTVSGGKLESILEKMTGNILSAIVTGALVTALIQSSSAVTVIVVGLVNAKSLKLRNAIGIIMGANIGTTITAQILRLTDLSTDNLFFLLLNPKALAPIASIVGILLFMTARKSMHKSLGSMLIGFGVLFSGMFAMEGAVAPLAELPQFADWFLAMSNPLLGVLVGAVVTGILQSSAASIGILQALSSTGVITFSAAFPIIMGQNIGTCVTTLLACVGTSKNAKRTAVVHLLFNTLGTLLFLAAVYLLQSLMGFPFWNDAIDKGGIANFHTLFNLTCTLIFIPFAGLLEKTVCFLIPDKKNAGRDDAPITVTLETRLLNSPALALEQGRNAVASVAALCQRVLDDAIAQLDHYDPHVLSRIDEAEAAIDKIDDRVGLYLQELSQAQMSEKLRLDLTKLLHMMSDIEQVGDCVQSVSDTATQLYECSGSFSDQAKEELANLFQATQEMLTLTIKMIQSENRGLVTKAEALEDVIDAIEAQLKENHIDRLRDGVCDVKIAFLFVSLIDQCEKIADYCSKIGVCILTYSQSSDRAERHEFSRRVHDGQIEGYASAVRDWRKIYQDHDYK